MHSLTTVTAATLSLVMSLLFSAHVTTSFTSHDTLPNCNHKFSCGSITGITYPFTGGSRPSYCGLPGFHLTCDNDSTTTLLSTDSLSYRVNQLDQITQTLNLSRSDLYETTCTNQFLSTTLNSTLFTLGSDNEILSLFYGCNGSVLTDKPPNLFSCAVNGVSSGDAYYLIGPVPNDPVLGTINCNISVTVPILMTWDRQLEVNRSLIGVLRHGFSVNYSYLHKDDCAVCYYSGWQCGFDAELGRPICICGDRICTDTGPLITSLPVTIAIVVSAIVAMIILPLVIAICITKKRGKGMIIRGKNAKHDEKIEAFIKNYHALTIKRYPYSDVKKMTNSFKDKLGGGGFGNVYKGKLQDGRLVAVKVLNNTECDGEDFINEVATISRTSHVNVVTLLGFCYGRSKRALIYEYMPNGSLDKFIYSKNMPHLNKLLEWRTLYEIVVGIARGLEYLHRGCNTRIVHFDIKPHNILLDQNFCPKISDFGLAKPCKREQSELSMSRVRGTIGYIAPELICQSFGEISYKSDVYSYGLMVLEMAGGRKNVDVGVSHTSEIYFPGWIYKHLESSSQVSTVHGVKTEEEEETARKMIIVGLWCIQAKPSDRPSMTKVVEMLEGSVQSLQIPPRPSLSAPATATSPRPQECSSTTSS